MREPIELTTNTRDAIHESPQTTTSPHTRESASTKHKPETLDPTGEFVHVDTIATKLIAGLRAAAHRGRARIRPAAGLPAGLDARAPEPRVSDRRASNT
eukprot:2568828-Prymnesium_polylepis.1